MKILFISSLAVLMLSACSKREVPDAPVKVPDPVTDLPDMIITELKDVRVEYKRPQRIDLNLDGVNDLTFAVWYIGNPNQQEDELLYFAASGTESALMVGEENNSPRFGKNEIIPVSPVQGHEWYIVSQVEMAMKNIGTSAQPYWEKDWKNASHKFLAVRVNKNGLHYYGWVEVSMDTVNSQLVLHRAAISKIADTPVKTGL